MRVRVVTARVRPSRLHALRGGVVIGVPDRSDEIEARLRQGETFSAELEGESNARSASIELVVASEYYFETGDLAAV